MTAITLHISALVIQGVWCCNISCYTWNFWLCLKIVCFTSVSIEINDLNKIQSFAYAWVYMCVLQLCQNLPLTRQVTPEQTKNQHQKQHHWPSIQREPEGETGLCSHASHWECVSLMLNMKYSLSLSVCSMWWVIPSWRRVLYRFLCGIMTVSDTTPS